MRGVYQTRRWNQQVKSHVMDACQALALDKAYQAFFANVNGAKSHVPALYVFGDSGLDAGNNNNLKTLAKANVAPYGIDFNNKSTGRYTNGKTFADIIAIKLGLPFSPPYLGVCRGQLCI
ncbi:PREDICTED: GDSL esterase/lipase At2g03980-like [Lupinus angustifolius]|uniref:GDSL esterase/lipase At2g03980-like n=1 Tax=Lupinus angustifolius TaxID=3871 RepID=UPI00092FD748|nr:PREDICTED: GDSL esterase/lipase At2g03980-like [Lupinus angustifolius]